MGFDGFSSSSVQAKGREAVWVRGGFFLQGEDVDLID